MPQFGTEHGDLLPTLLYATSESRGCSPWRGVVPCLCVVRLTVSPMPSSETRANCSSADPVETYLEMKGDLPKVLSLPLEGKKELFRDFLVGYLMAEHHYPEEKALRLVAGNEDAILLMLTEEHPSGLW